ncbi:hypothetical protein ACI7RC_00405 [Brevibacillus sp. B_LB10_24]|uniref:hypothetical protein n=1 Tax=Brevibacillus sp. B_LB10_24 TaxID=3380645 RepID=UPI0038B71C9D
MVKESRDSSDRTADEQGVPSFNSVTDHYQNIMGVPKQTVDLNSMPKPLRWFGYFFYAIIGIGAIFLVIGLIYNYLFR